LDGSTTDGFNWYTKVDQFLKEVHAKNLSGNRLNDD